MVLSPGLACPRLEIALSAAYGAHSFHGNENAAEALDAADRAMYERKKKKQREGEA